MMLFKSVFFLYAFLPGTLLAFFTAHKFGLLQVASCVFYSAWKWHIFKIRYPKFQLGRMKMCPFA